MEDVIKQIIEMDRKAQQTTEAAQREKLTCEKEIEEKVQALREEYLQKARRRIQINSEMDRTIMEQKWEKCQAHYDAQAEDLEQAYAQHHDEWADEMVRRILEH